MLWVYPWGNVRDVISESWLRKIFYDVDFLRKRNKKFEGRGTFNQLRASSYTDLFEGLLLFLLTNHLTGLTWVSLTVVTKLGLST